MRHWQPDELTKYMTLPANWASTTLHEICDVNPTMSWPDTFEDDTLISFVPMAAVDEFAGAIVSADDRPIGEVWRGYKRFAEGDVIFARITPCMENGKAAIARGLTCGIGTGSTEFHVLRPLAGILPEWVYYYVRQQSFRDQAEGKMKGTAGQLRVPTDYMRQAQIPLAPLVEQRRIVAEIEKQFSRLDKAVEALKRAQANLKRYKASVLKVACEGRLVPQDPNDEPASVLLARILKERRAKWEADERARMEAKGKRPRDDSWKRKYKEPAPPDTRDLPALPAGWVWATFDMVGQVQGGIQKQPKRAPRNNAYPYLRVANVFRGYLDLSEVYEFELFEGELERLRLQAGDLLVVEGNGSRHEIGRCALWSGEIENCVHQNHIIRVRFAGVLPTYASHYLNSPRGIEHMMKVASSTSGLYTLSVSKVKSITFPLAPIGEQHRIVEEADRRLSIVEEIERLVEANLRRAERLRQSILKRAFEGRLVPQDPHDEPASALLARIRAARKKGRKPEQMKLL